MKPLLNFITEYKAIVDFLSATLAPVIAIVAVFIAYQQWRTNKLRIKIELFDRRHKVYQHIADFLGSVISTGGVEPDIENKFLSGTRVSLFLFDASVESFVEEIFQKAGHLHALKLDQKNISGDKLSANLNSESKITQWFKQELINLPKRFSKFLSINYRKCF